MDNNLTAEKTEKKKPRTGLRNLVRAIAFLLVFARCFLWVQDLIVPNRDLPDFVRRLNKSMTGLQMREPRNSLDILWAGTSHVLQGISPMEIYRQTGIRSHLISMNSQRAVTAYYLLKQAFTRQSPKLVVMDVSAFTYAEKYFTDKTNWQESIDTLNVSMLGTRIAMAKKLSELRNEPFDDDYIRRSVFPLLHYHTHYMLNRYDWRDMHMEQVYYRKGYDLEFRRYGVDEKNLAKIEELIGYVEDEDLEIEAVPEAQPVDEIKTDIHAAIESNRIYFENIINLCRKNGCEPVFIKIPVHRLTTYRGYWSQEKHDLFQKMADDYGVRFLDMNYEDVGIDWSMDTTDGGSHLNYDGAVKVSSFLAKWIQDNFSFEVKTSDKLKKLWDTQLALYDWEIEKYNLSRLNDLNEYFDALQASKKTIMVSVNGPVSEFWTDELQNRFTQITGCDLDLRLPECAALGLISSNGDVIEEEHNGDLVEQRGAFDGDIAYTVKSSSDNGNSPGRIRINHHTLTSPGVGVQIVVYDDETKCAVDSVLICNVVDEEAGTSEIVLRRPNNLYTRYLSLNIDKYVVRVMASV